MRVICISCWQILISFREKNHKNYQEYDAFCVEIDLRFSEIFFYIAWFIFSKQTFLRKQIPREKIKPSIQLSKRISFLGEKLLNFQCAWLDCFQITHWHGFFWKMGWSRGFKIHRYFSPLQDEKLSIEHSMVVHPSPYTQI